MAQRRGWDSLSPAYRKRLLGAGISKTAYESGQSIRRARGHENTPEHPNQTITVQQFPTYFTRKATLITRLNAKKQRIFGGSPRWDTLKSDQAIRQHTPALKDLEYWIAAPDQELIDAVRYNYDTYKWLGYH